MHFTLSKKRSVILSKKGFSVTHKRQIGGLFSVFAQRMGVQSQRGFTVVELMVTITIVVLATGIIMLQYSSFNSSVLLKSQAYLTAFDIREAQSLAVSVRGQSGPSAQFYEQYGLYFDMSKPHQYLLFQDDDDLNAGVDQNPAEYDAGEEIGVPYIVDPRFEIIDICAIVGSNTTCYSDSGHTFSTLAISFKRPDFDAAFYAPGVAGSPQAVEIHFGTGNANSLVRTITVYTTGQIKID